MSIKEPGIIAYSPTEAGLAEMTKRLAVVSFDCKTVAGYEGARKGIAECRDLRVAVEKKRVELKADALEYGRKVDAEAKRITAALLAIEEPLKAAKAAIDDEKERVRREAEEKRLAAEKAERDRIAAEAEAKRQAEVAAENARLAAEREALRLEREKVESERRAQEEAALAIRKKQEAEHAAQHAELARQKAAQEAESARVRAEQAAAQKKIDDERRSIELEKAKAEAAEKARVEAEQRHAREKAEAEARAKREKEEAERLAKEEEAERLREEALRPDREKLLAVADAVAAIEVPAVGEDAVNVQQEIAEFLDMFAAQIRDTVNKGLPAPKRRKAVRA